MQLYIISLYHFHTMHDYEIFLKRIQGYRDGFRKYNRKIYLNNNIFANLGTVMNYKHRLTY